MENLTLQNQLQTSKIIKFKVNSLVSTLFPVTLNQIMIAKSVLQAKSNTLLLQKNVDLDELININPEQEEMRTIARRYLNQYLPELLALLTDITGFYNLFCSYYADIEDYINQLNNHDNDEQKGLLADLDAMLNDIIDFIAEKKKDTHTLEKILKTENEKNASLHEKFSKTRSIAEQKYIGDKTVISTLEARIQKLLSDIEHYNTQIASGALDSAKTILKITTTLIAHYIKAKKPETKPETKVPEDASTREPIPIVANNLQLFSENKTIETLPGKKLQQSIDLYRECIEQLQKYNSEATILTILIQQWDAFINGMVTLAESIEYFAKAWQELEQSFTRFKKKFSEGEAIDENRIELMKQQWSLSYADLLQLNNKAIDFQRLSYLDVVKDQDKGKYISSYAFKTLLGIPNLNNSQLNQRIITNHSKK